MEFTSGDVWFAVAVLLIATVATKIAIARAAVDPTCTRPLPPVVKGVALLGLLHALVTKDLPTVIHDLYEKFGSVFTVSLLGQKVTFLVGPEVSAHFFKGLESEINIGNLLNFTVPIFGQEVGYGVDLATRNEQARFCLDALKPSKLRSHVDPMLQEVEEYFAKWGQHGIVDLKHEFEVLLMLISSRVLLGKEVREKMFDEFCTLFGQIENGVNLVSVFFPYIPIPANQRRDRARVKLTQILSEVVSSRKSSGRVEEDTLQRLIDCRYKDGRSTTEAEITGMIIGMLFAGKHTSSHTTIWTGACLLNSPKFLAAAVEEQKELVVKYKDQIDYNTLAEMDALHCCIKEALRMHPPSPVLVRKAQKQFTVKTNEGNEYDIPRGHTIASPTIVNNNMHYIYKEPQVYDPDRFGPGRAEDIVGGKFSYTSFGSGRHACIGESYAYMQIKLIWSHLLRNFELELVSPFPRTDWNKIVPGPQGKVMVSYKRSRMSA